MLNRYFGLLKKDIITGLRNYYFLIVVAVAILFVFIINFLIPENVSIKPSVYYFNEYEGQLREDFSKIINQSKVEHGNIYEAKSREEIIENMKKNINSIGMVIKDVDNRPTIEFILQGYENPKVRNALIISIKDQIYTLKEGNIDVKVVKIKEGIETERIPVNKNVLPLFLVMEPSTLGLILIAALIFMEKEEGTIKAYIVTPGRLPEYLASKITLMAILGIISTVISSVFVVGSDADYLSLILLILLGGIFFSTLGLIIASFFENISQSTIWIILVSILVSVPFVSYFVPSFAPTYITLIPTYPLMFAIREAIFPTGNSSIIYSTLLYFLILSAIGYILSLVLYRRHLIRE